MVERFFNRINNWRAIASRYDKHVTVYRGGIILAAIVDWGGDETSAQADGTMHR